MIWKVDYINNSDDDLDDDDDYDLDDDDYDYDLDDDDDNNGNYITFNLLNGKTTYSLYFIFSRSEL